MASEKTMIPKCSSTTISKISKTNHFYRSISEAGHALYYYIESADDIPESFADCIGGLLSVVAQDIVINIEPVNNVKINKLSTHYPNEKSKTGGYSVRLGDIYSEETRNIVCNVNVPTITSEVDSFSIIEFSVSYFNTLTRNLEKITTIATIKRPSETPKNQVIDQSLDRQKNRLITADVIENARKIADVGDLKLAREHLQNAIGQIKNSPSGSDELCKVLIADLEESHKDMENKAEYHSKGVKKMMWKAQAHEKERCVGKGGYDTKAKSGMKAQVMSQLVPVVPSLEFDNTPTLSKKLVIGNEYEEIKSTGISGNGHKWKMFVRGQEIDQFVDYVVYELHPTFQPSKVTVKTAPFELERSGWGTFTVVVKVYFKSALKKKPCRFEHDLTFGQSVFSNEFLV